MKNKNEIKIDQKVLATVKKLYNAYGNGDYTFVEKLTKKEKKTIRELFEMNIKLKAIEGSSPQTQDLDLLEEFYNKAVFIVNLSKNNLVFINR
ncbi:hypothetical protein [Providencia sp. MGF014]|uniref:hypothetical protein n=1 Tax=Providencia sp. MGF014 TaxID=2565573 RepID=UPI00109C5362|nr:hypothetical protein [Providencia sp. MGF014]THB18581.1 hypothetical protein E6R27_21935 [Providencia sp. MGF014]